MNVYLCMCLSMELWNYSSCTSLSSCDRINTHTLWRLLIINSIDRRAAVFVLNSHHAQPVGKSECIQICKQKNDSKLKIPERLFFFQSFWFQKRSGVNSVSVLHGFERDSTCWLPY